MSAWIEKAYKVGSDKHKGVYLSVAPSADCPDSYVMLYTENKESSAYFGPMRLELEADLMRKLGQALIACADDLEKTND